jgi:AcrR family transcriptional regulator
MPLASKTRSSGGAGATRQRILDAAIKAFAALGFSGASLREIGKNAEINFQSIRYHFGSKEQLWEEVVKALCLEAQEAATHNEQATAALKPKDRLRAQIHAIVAYESANPALQQILIREAIKDSKRYRTVYKKYVSRFFDLAAAFLGEMQKEGAVKADIPLDDLAFVAQGAIIYRLIAPAHVAIHAGNKTKPADIIDQHAEAISKLLMAE